MCGKRHGKMEALEVGGQFRGEPETRGQSSEEKSGRILKPPWSKPSMRSHTTNLGLLRFDLLSFLPASTESIEKSSK